jgi:hypothetical protein
MKVSFFNCHVTNTTHVVCSVIQYYYYSSVIGVGLAVAAHHNRSGSRFKHLLGRLHFELTSLE